MVEGIITGRTGELNRGGGETSGEQVRRTWTVLQGKLVETAELLLG